MHLGVSIVFLFILLTGGCSLNCYNCQDQRGPCEEHTTCDNEHSKCASRRVTEIENTGYCIVHSDTNEASCAKPDACESWSYSKLIWSKSVSIQCCDTDLCNGQYDPDYYHRYDENGKICFTCDEGNCSHTVSCKGDEDYCFTAYKYHSQYQPQIVKGCASTYICYNATEFLELGKNISCCSGDLCNGAESVTRSLLFFCCSLLFFVLLH